MYGQLLFDPADVATPWTVKFFVSVDLAPPALSYAQAGERGSALKQLKSEVPDLTKAELDALMVLCKGLPLSRTDLVSDLYLSLAHLRLPEAQRKAREALIVTTLESWFDRVPQVPEIVSGIDHIKLIAPLAPDVFLENMVCSQVTKLQMVFMTVPAWVAHCTEQVDRLVSLTTALGVQSRSPEDRQLVEACFSRAWGKRQAFLDLLASAVQFKLADAVRKTEVALRGTDLLSAPRGDILANVLQDCRAAGLDGSMQAEIDAVVANQVALGRAGELARLRAVLGTSIDATLAGVLMPTKVRTQNLAAIAAASQAGWQQLLRMTPERLRLLKTQDPALVARQGAAAAAPADLDPVHAWSVNRLLRWIEGPIIEPAPAPLDRAKFVAKENAARQEARANTKMAEKAAHADQDLTATDVDLAVQNALNTTAEFFIGDIEDMLFRAKALNSASPVMQACADLLEPLHRLQMDDRSDDQKARALLHQAEAAIERLRADITTIASDVRTRQRFAQQLQVALSRESLVEGKRHGGVINCVLKRSDWPWVAEQYHRRWLPCTQQIAFDGVPRSLQPDQALGLYVTGKSLSGYEFDVSVHLWQRKPGLHSTPYASLTPFAPMNTADWIDTLTPCAVLHVPSAI